MVLPYTQVEYIFGTSAVSPALATYYGCIMGKATKLHDLVCKGWYTPGEFDCGGDGTTAEYNNFDYRDPVKTVTPEGADNTLPYPGFSKDNTAVINSVKTYFKDLKSVSLFQDKFIAIPLSKSSFRVAKLPETGNPVEYTEATDISKFFEIKDGAIKTKTIEITFDNPSEGEILVPGTFLMRAGDYILSDLNLDVADPSVPSELTNNIRPVNGTIYVYKQDGSGWVKPRMKESIAYTYADGAFRFTGQAKLYDTTTAFSEITSISIFKASWLVKEGDEVIDVFNGTRCAVDSGQDMFYLGKRAYSDETYVDTDFNITLPGTSLISMAEVKEAFYKAEYQKIAKPSDNIVVVSVGVIDHTTGEVLANGNVFNSGANYAPCLGVAICRVADDKPVRFNVDIDENTGSFDIDPGSMLFTTRDYEYKGGETVYLGCYDTDPNDPEDRPQIYDSRHMTANFISGKLRVEYEEQVTSPTAIGENGLYRTDLISGKMEDYIGQPDPRNQLGYAYALVRQLTSADMYALVIDDLQTGFDTLEKYRDIFHIWYVSDKGANSLFYSWIEHENEKEQSRFRIGYQYQPISDEVVKHERLAAMLQIDDDDTIPYSLHADGAQFLSKDKVIPGDTVAEIDNKTGATIRTFTVQTVNEEDLAFLDAYAPKYDLKGTGADPVSGTQVWTYADTEEHPFDKNDWHENTLRVSCKYMETNNETHQTVSKSWEGAYTDIDSDLFDSLTLAADNITATLKVASAETVPGGSTPVLERTFLYCNFDMRHVDYESRFNIYRVYNTEEKVEKLVGDQSSNNMACVTVLTRNVHYTSPVYQALSEEDKADFEKSADMQDYKFMPDYATPGLIFGTKLATQPHMPLTLVSFSIDGMGDVTGLREFSRKQLEKLLEAGYCMINSEIGMLPYCETDCTVGYRYYGDSDRGLLSKITPVLMYGKDVYNVTNDWKGPMNTGTPELLSGLGTALTILKKKYTETYYNLLGTLLKNVEDASISFDGSHIIIIHHISSQDPARYIDNTVYVE